MDYSKLKETTNNFSELNNFLLCNNSSFMRVVRISMGLSSPNFAILLDKSPSTIQCIEDKKGNMLFEKSKEYMDKLKILIKEHNINLNDFELIKNNYEKFYTNRLFSIMQSKVSHNSHVISGKKAGETTLKKYGVEHFKNMAKIGARKGGIAISKKYPHKHFQSIGRMTYEKYGKNKLSNWGRKGGFITASKQRLTEQESEIKKHLDNFEIPYKVHGRIKGENRDYIVDFLINIKGIRIVIEATNQRHKSQLGIYNKSLDLMKRIEDIKLKSNYKICMHLKQKALY